MTLTVAEGIIELEHLDKLMEEFKTDDPNQEEYDNLRSRRLSISGAIQDAEFNTELEFEGLKFTVAEGRQFQDFHKFDNSIYGLPDDGLSILDDFILKFFSTPEEVAFNRDKLLRLRLSLDKLILKSNEKILLEI